jgi:hypothetical protein
MSPILPLTGERADAPRGRAAENGCRAGGRDGDRGGSPGSDRAVDGQWSDGDRAVIEPAAGGAAEAGRGSAPATIGRGRKPVATARNL